MVQRSIAEAVETVDDGSTIAFGGMTLHRTPMAFARELVRRHVSDLTVVGVTNSMEVDVLCGAGVARAVHFGYVGFEHIGLAPNFRNAVESGATEALEGTCYTVETMLRGAKQGVPFLPVAGLDGSDLLDVRDDFTRVRDPFSETSTVAVRSVTPDVAVVHVVEADKRGNARFYGADFTESVVVKAADEVIVTAERIVDTQQFRDDPERTDLSEVFVDTVVHAPYGAHPCSCPGEYDYDEDHLRRYVERSERGKFDDYIAEYVGQDESSYRSRAVDGRKKRLAWESGGEFT